MESVAAGDGAADRSSPLTRYYAESGTPPGRFLGAGLGDLDNGRGVEPGTQVTEEHLRLMLVALADPVSGEPVGGAPKAPKGAAPVAGFDLCFSPPLCRARHKCGYADLGIMPSRHRKVPTSQEVAATESA
jgi:TrwC relaxase